MRHSYDKRSAGRNNLVECQAKEIGVRRLGAALF